MRESIDSYFMKIAETVATRSTCLRRNIGAIIVKDTHILVCGYNGPPTGIPHCKTCARENIPSGERVELCLAAHAEQNCINFSARYGIAINGATLYSTNKPCSQCAKSIINSGIVKVVYHLDYPDSLTDCILQDIICLKFQCQK